MSRTKRNKTSPFSLESLERIRHAHAGPYRFEPPAAPESEVKFEPEVRFDPKDRLERQAATNVSAFGSMFQRYRKVILLSAIGGLAAGLAVGALTKPMYRASTSLEVRSSSNGEEQLEAELLKSNALLDRVFRELTPDNLTASSEPGVTARQTLLTSAARSLTVSLDPRTHLIEVKVDSPDRQLAADFANTLAQEFAAQDLMTRLSAYRETIEGLSRKADDARAKLQSSEDDLQAYTRDSGLADDAAAVSEKLQRARNEFSAASADRAAKQAFYEQVKDTPSESLAALLNDAKLRETAARLKALRRELVERTSFFDPDSRGVNRLRSEVESLQAAFERDCQRAVSRIEAEYQQAAVTEKNLSESRGRLSRAASGRAERQAEHDHLESEVRDRRQIYNAALQEMSQASARSVVNTRVRIVDAAEVPAHPISLNIQANAALGLMTGFLLCVAVLSIRDRSRRGRQFLNSPGGAVKETFRHTLTSIPPAGENGSEATVIDAGLCEEGWHPVFDVPNRSKAL